LAYALLSPLISLPSASCTGFPSNQCQPGILTDERSLYEISSSAAITLVWSRKTVLKLVEQSTMWANGWRKSSDPDQSIGRFCCVGKMKKAIHKKNFAITPWKIGFLGVNLNIFFTKK
jgi:hypothetical protein